MTAIELFNYSTILVPIESPYATSINLYLILDRFRVITTENAFILIPSFGVNLNTYKLRKLKTSLYRGVHKRFDLLNRLDVEHQCDRRTDRETDHPLPYYAPKLLQKGCE